MDASIARPPGLVERLPRWLRVTFLAALFADVMINQFSSAVPNVFTIVWQWLRAAAAAAPGARTEPVAKVATVPAAVAAEPVRSGPVVTEPPPAVRAEPAGPAAIRMIVDCDLNCSRNRGWEDSAVRLELRETGRFQSATLTHWRWEVRARDGSVIVDRTVRLPAIIRVAAGQSAIVQVSVDELVRQDFNARQLVEHPPEKDPVGAVVTVEGTDEAGEAVTGTYYKLSP